MLARYFGVAALALECAHAFKDASPFFLFSSSELDTQQFPNAHVGSSSKIVSDLSTINADCSSHTYVFVSQHGVSSADFTAQLSTPHLKRRLGGEDKHIKTAVKIANVVGEIDVNSLGKMVQKQCGGKSFENNMKVYGSVVDVKVPHIDQNFQSISVGFSAPPTNKDERASALARYDSYLNDILAQLDSYTVFYTTRPVSADDYQEIQHPDPSYEMDSPFPAGMHGDLKRDLGVHVSAANTSNLYSNVPLFEKYQFVNQGIFIGGSVTLLLLLILSVGVRAISGLEVSYMAFSKEMGPAAQKK